MLRILTLGILLLFSVSVYALNPVEVPLNTVENNNGTMLERQEQTLQWIRTLKNSMLEQTEPYVETVQELQKDAKFKTEDFQCGCNASQNHFSDTTLYPTEDVVNALSSVSLKSESNAAVYVFVSLSMPKPALIALNMEALELGAALVLRGFKDNSYQKTALYLQEIIEKTGQGFLIHPELFKRYQIEQVPSVVLTTNSVGVDAVFDVVSGHIPIKTALSKIFDKGELKGEAKAWLQRNNYAD